MGHNFAKRAAAGAVSTALALGIGAPAVLASPSHRASSAPVAPTRVSSAAAASSQRSLPARGYPPVSLYSQDPCSPFYWRLSICVDVSGHVSPTAFNPPSPRPTPVRTVTHSAGVDWSEAAIAAAALALVAIGLGGIRTTTHHRTRHPATS